MKTILITATLYFINYAYSQKSTSPITSDEFKEIVKNIPSPLPDDSTFPCKEQDATPWLPTEDIDPVIKNKFDAPLLNVINCFYLGGNPNLDQTSIIKLDVLGRINVDITGTSHATDSLINFIKIKGGRVETQIFNMVYAWIPVSLLISLAQRDDVYTVHAPHIITMPSLKKKR